MLGNSCDFYYLADMGFRSTVTSFDLGGSLPEWFVKKYRHELFFAKDSLMLSTKTEFKIYTNELFEDYQQALKEGNCVYWTGKYGPSPVVVCAMDEDGGIKKVEILPDSIKYFRCYGFEELD